MIEMDRESWEQGVKDGATMRRAPAWAMSRSHGKGRDSYSYSSGRIEGEAFRGGHEVSVEVAKIGTSAAGGSQ